MATWARFSPRFRPSIRRSNSPPWPKSRRPDILGATRTFADLIARDAGRIAAALNLSREEAAGEARILLAQALARSRAWVMAHDRDPVDASSDALQRYEQWTARRAQGEPFAYIVGRREFFGRDFEVGPDVLIPRPETELLVEVALDHLPHARDSRVLDLGTGSGCIALTIASEAARAAVLATDASPEALATAVRNAQALDVENVDFLLSDWFAELRGLRFDLIVSNPPYVAGDDAHLQAGDLPREPRMALTPGPTGLEAIDRISSDAPDFLCEDGWLMLEHGHDQGEAVRALLQHRGFASIATLRDLAGIERVTVAQRTATRNR